MNYNSFRTAIANAIDSNGVKAITGKVLQDAILSVIDALDLGSLYLGEATTTTRPSSEANGFYLALQTGTYTHFQISVAKGEVALIVKTDSRWKKQVLTVMPYIDPVSKHWIVNGEDSGVLAEGQQGQTGPAAVSPFKGWFNTDDIPTTGQEGDYCYVDDDGTTKVWRWNPNAEPPAFEETADTPDTDHTQTFASNESVNEVAIDKSHLENPVNTADPTKPVLAKAEDVMQLKAKLEGVTASETKQNYTLEDGYVNYDGSIKTTSSKHVVIALGNAKRVRFLGQTIGSQSGSNLSYAFWNAATYVDESTVVFSTYYDQRTGDESQPKEYLVNIPNGATHIAISIGSLNENNFYCYLQSGVTVGDEFRLIEGSINGFETIQSITPVGNSNYTFEKIYQQSSVTSDLNAKVLRITNQTATFRINVEKFRGRKIIIYANATDYAYYMVLAKFSSLIRQDVMTLGELVNGGFLCEAFHYDGNEGLWKNCVSLKNNTSREITIPDDAVEILFAKKNCFLRNGTYTVESVNRLPEKLDIFCKTDGLIDDVGKMKNTLYGEEKETEIAVDFLEATRERISLSSEKIQTGSKAGSVGQECYKIPLQNVTTIKITAASNYSAVFFISKNELATNQVYYGLDVLADETEDDGYEVNDNSTYRMSIAPNDERTIRIAKNALYLYIQRYYSDTTQDRTPSSLILETTEIVGGLANTVKELQDNSVNVSNKGISLFLGSLDEDGHLVYDEFHATTGFLSLGSGFLVTLRKGLQVKSAMLYDIDGNLLNNEFYARKARFTGGWGCAKMLPQFLVRLVIGNDDDTEIGSISNVISDFTLLDDKRLVRVIPENKRFKEMHIRLNQLENVVWNNKTKLSYHTSTKYNPATWIGIPYSETSEFTKYVGNHVMLKTFLTAVKNIRSVLYTEHINQENGTQYGFIYHGLSDLSGTFFGSVCSGLTSYVRNKKNVLMEDGEVIAYGEYKISTGETSIHITGSSNIQDSIDDLFNVIEPLDVIWNTGHVTIVSDVYKDEFGDKKIIVISEQTTPLGFSTPFTKEMLLNRLNVTVNETESGLHKEWEIRRYDDWNTLTSPLEDTSDYIQNEWMRYTPEELEIDSDISTFCGEYATFCINGDDDDSDAYNNYKAFLNIHRGGNIYDALEIYSDDDTLIDTYSIVSNDDNIIKQSNIYSNDAADKEDWIIFDLSKISLSAGKYKARLKNSADNIFSGYTHFEMVEVSLKVTKADGGGYNVTYSSDGGVPYLMRQERLNGLMPSSDKDRVIELNEQEPTTYVDWTKLSNAPYIKLFVRGEYGVVVKRLEMPDA